ncbi:MAG: T9SS type A sorting domain-containing protein [Candidatus Marinimicrobia bacterium]|nr:T9SS type A sorting domain-containing protein [Candidatus Neomarinimicrobiota bacterium]
MWIFPSCEVPTESYDNPLDEEAAQEEGMEMPTLVFFPDEINVNSGGIYGEYLFVKCTGRCRYSPKTFSLKNNYPNPFNPITNIHYELPVNARVKITIYDLLGREVKKLVSGELVSGYHKTIWDATNDYGKPVSAGVYFYMIHAG